MCLLTHRVSTDASYSLLIFYWVVCCFSMNCLGDFIYILDIHAYINVCVCHHVLFIIHIANISLLAHELLFVSLEE